MIIVPFIIRSSRPKAVVFSRKWVNCCFQLMDEIPSLVKEVYMCLMDLAWQWGQWKLEIKKWIELVAVGLQVLSRSLALKQELHHQTCSLSLSSPNNFAKLKGKRWSNYCFLSEELGNPGRVWNTILSYQVEYEEFGNLSQALLT